MAWIAGWYSVVLLRVRPRCVRSLRAKPVPAGSPVPPGPGGEGQGLQPGPPPLRPLVLYTRM